MNEYRFSSIVAVDIRNITTIGKSLLCNIYSKKGIPILPKIFPGIE